VRINASANSAASAGWWSERVNRWSLAAQQQLGCPGLIGVGDQVSNGAAQRRTADVAMLARDAVGPSEEKVSKLYDLFRGVRQQSGKSTGSADLYQAVGIGFDVLDGLEGTLGALRDLSQKGGEKA